MQGNIITTEQAESYVRRQGLASRRVRNDKGELVRLDIIGQLLGSPNVVIVGNETCMLALKAACGNS